MAHTKGTKSLTHPGDVDYSTKRGDKLFHHKKNGKKEEKEKRLPFEKVAKDMGEGGSGVGDEAEERKPTRRMLPTYKMKSLRNYRIQKGVVPRTFSGSAGAVIG
jgi:hypothetical protein